MIRIKIITLTMSANMMSRCVRILMNSIWLLFPSAPTEKSEVSLMPEKDVVETTLGSQMAVIRMDMNAFPKPDLYWYFNGHLITNESNFKQ